LRQQAEIFGQIFDPSALVKYSSVLNDFAVKSHGTNFWKNNDATTNVPSKVRKCATAQYHQTICAVKSHIRTLAAFQI